MRGDGLLVPLALAAALSAGCGSQGGASAVGTSKAPTGSLTDNLSADEERQVKDILAQPAATEAAVRSLSEVAGQRETKPQLRYAALRRIESGGAPEGVTALRDLVNGAGNERRERFVASNAIAALVRMSRPEARAALNSLVALAAPYKKEAVVNLLGHLGTDDDLFILQTALADPDPALRARAEQSRNRILAR